MADVSIDASVGNSPYVSVVFVSPTVGYCFYSDSDSLFKYSKTSDGGASWGAGVTISTTGNLLAYGIWFDKGTPGDSGTLIHTCYFGSSTDDLFWRTLDTSGDGLGTERIVFAGATFSASSSNPFCSVTKTISGYIYVAYDGDAGVEKGLFRSTDSGTSWSANLSTTFVEAGYDRCKLYPASNTGDNNDCWAIYEDVSASALTLKMWDSSAASATESATIQAFTSNTTLGTGYYGWDASVRQSDGHLILASISERDLSTADHQVYDINGTGSITALTAITTNIDDHYFPSVYIDQLTNDIYVAYNGKRDGSEVMDTTTKVYYTKSIDYGASWSAGDTAYMEGAAGIVLQTFCPKMGDRFYVGWQVAATILGNYVNSIDTSGGGGPPPSSTYTDTLPFMGAG